MTLRKALLSFAVLSFLIPAAESSSLNEGEEREASSSGRTAASCLLDVPEDIWQDIFLNLDADSLTFLISCSKKTRAL